MVALTSATGSCTGPASAANLVPGVHPARSRDRAFHGRTLTGRASRYLPRMEDQDNQRGRATPAAWSGPVLIRPDRVFDGVGLHEGAQVLIEDGKISAVGTNLDPSRQIPTVDGRCSTLMPGLIDAHAHISSGRLEQSVVFGVTTVLDMFSDPAAARQLKSEAEESPGRMASMYSSGTGATGPGCWPWGLVEAGIFSPFPTVRRADEADAFVADRIAEGSDYIKIFAASKPIRDEQLAPDIVAALIDAAHKHRRLAVVHALDTTTALEAIQLGADGLMHANLDHRPGSRLAEVAAEHNVFIVPTMGVSAGILGRSRGPAVRDDPQLSPYLDDMAKAFLSIERSINHASSAHSCDQLLKAVAEFNSTGVSLLAGTDATNPGVAHGASLHDELTLLTQAGLTPTQALTAATHTPARAFGLSDRGSIEPGRRADLLLVDGNPTSDITRTRHIRDIWHNGVPVKRSSSPGD